MTSHQQSSTSFQLRAEQSSSSKANMIFAFSVLKEASRDRGGMMCHLQPLLTFLSNPPTMSYHIRTPSYIQFLPDSLVWLLVLSLSLASRTVDTCASSRSIFPVLSFSWVTSKRDGPKIQDSGSCILLYRRHYRFDGYGYGLCQSIWEIRG